VTEAEHQAEREALSKGIQHAFAEHEGGVLVTGYFLVAEVVRPDGSTYLAYRNSDINGEGLKSWVSLGFLHSACGAVEEQSRDGIVDVDEDDDGC
jgi:hypothetical protein